MGHSISAVILKGEVDPEAARRFDMRIVALQQGFSMVPLDASYCDHWSEALGIHGFLSERPLLNGKVVHHMILQAFPSARFAVIDTDYFGGVGSQAAVVYEGSNTLMEPQAATTGPINEALRLLGVKARRGQDEFDALELGAWRHFDDMFEKYQSTA